MDAVTGQVMAAMEQRIGRCINHPVKIIEYEHQRMWDAVGQKRPSLRLRKQFEAARTRPQIPNDY